MAPSCPSSSDKGQVQNLEDVEIDEATAKRLLRKIDWKLMPVMCFTYALQYYDKAILSQAAIFGLREDLEIEDGLKYSWVSLIFYFGYLVGTYPISLLAQKFRTRVVCSVICVLWAVIILCTPACKTYTGLLVNRFFLGLVEAGVSPICMLVVGLWYTHSEQVLRSSFWYSCSGGSLLVSPLINYGLGHINGSLRPWQYMYLIAGVATFIWGVALWWLFPDSPQESPGFTVQERQLLMERIRSNNSSGENREFKAYQLKEALLDYQLWAILVLSITSTTGSGAVTTFGSIIFHDMGFSTFTSLLMNLPIGALAFICILGSGFLGRKFTGARLYIIAGSCLPVILGCALLWKLPDSMLAGRIVGFYLINFFSSAWTQCIGLGTSNVAGHTKKAVYAASTFVGYSIGNIVGPLMFDAKYSPRYNQSFTGLMVCFAVCFCASFVLRGALAAENRSRDSDADSQTSTESMEDLTDKENKRFRYNL